MHFYNKNTDVAVSSKTCITTKTRTTREKGEDVSAKSNPSTSRKKLDQPLTTVPISTSSKGKGIKQKATKRSEKKVDHSMEGTKAKQFCINWMIYV